MAAKQFYKEAEKGKGGKGGKGGGDQAFDIPGPKKAAIVMVALGRDASAEILKGLSEAEVEQLTKEIARLEGVTPEMREATLQEFHTMGLAQQYVSQGGIDYAKELLETTYGPARAQEILAAHAELARLLQALDRADEARRHFDACLELALAEV